MDKRDIAPVFRERLLQLQQQSGLNPSEFARQCQLDRSAMSQFLDPGNLRLPRAEALMRIASAQGVSIDWLLGAVGAKDGSQQIASSSAIELVDDSAQRSPLTQWREEISGGKTRYIPAYLPDMLSLPELVNHELEPHRASSRYSFGEELLYDVKKRGNDLEICLPVQALQELAQGYGIWVGIPKHLRAKQLDYMADLIDSHYPTLRVYFYDRLKHYSAPLTVFGNQRAVVYLGGSYLVVTGSEQVSGLSKHFDHMVRISHLLPHQTAQICRDMKVGAG